MWPIPPPPPPSNTLYRYMDLLTQGRGGRGGEELRTREKGRRATDHIAGLKIPTRLNVRKRLAIYKL